MQYLLGLKAPLLRKWWHPCVTKHLLLPIPGLLLGLFISFHKSFLLHAQTSRRLTTTCAYGDQPGSPALPSLRVVLSCFPPGSRRRTTLSTGYALARLCSRIPAWPQNHAQAPALNLSSHDVNEWMPQPRRLITALKMQRYSRPFEGWQLFRHLVLQSYNAFSQLSLRARGMCYF